MAFFLSTFFAVVDNATITQWFPCYYRWIRARLPDNEENKVESKAWYRKA